MALERTATYPAPTTIGAIPLAEPSVINRALDRTLVHGISWTGALKGITLLFSWASTVVVARLLSPEDYGLVAMATVFLGLTTMVTDFGLGGAIVALRDLDEDLRSQLHAVSLLIGVTAFAVSCIVAAPLSRFFGAPGLAVVVVVLGTGLVLDSLRTVPTALLARSLHFKYLAMLEASKLLTAVAVTLSLALLGGKYWSLVLGNVFAALVVTLFVLRQLPQRIARPRLRTLKSTLKFSSHFFIGNLAWYGYTNADFVVAGRVLGKVALGEYTLAWTLTSAPGEKLMAVFGRVMPTLFSAVQRDIAALRRYYLLFTEGFSVVIIPATAGLALVAPDFVPLVFGAKWTAAVIPLQLLCFFTAIHILATPNTPVLQVTGQASFPARIGLLLLVILPTGFYFSGLRWGTAGIAAVWLGLYPFILFPVFARVFRTLGITFRQYLASLAPTLYAAAVMAAVVLTVRAVSPATWHLGLRFGLEVAFGAAAFAAAGFFQRRRLRVLFDFFRTVRS